MVQATEDAPARVEIVTPELIALITRDSASYRSQDERGAYRAGLSSAVAVLDEVRGRFEKGSPSKREWAAIGALEICAALIWTIRETIRVDDRTSASPPATGA